LSFKKNYKMNLRNEIITLIISEAKKDRCYKKAKQKYKVFPSAYASGAIVRCRKGEIWKEIKDGVFANLVETKFKKEKEQGLHGWFSRNGGKGWIDCKASTKEKKVPCGREKASKGADREYPACRPTYSQCTDKGEENKKGKKRVDW
jgi:hypothetical protein